MNRPRPIHRILAAAGLPAWLLVVSTVAATETSLFTEDRPLDLELHVDLDALCRKADQLPCRDVPARLVHRAPDGTTELLPIRVRTRGDWRLDPRHCTYPPLFILFDENAAGSLFEGQDMLPMTPQCRSRRGRYKDWVLREHLAYQIYQQLTDKSVRTRLVRVTWAEPSGDDPEGPYWAFLAEHFRAMAARNGAEILDLETLELDTTDPTEIATLALFQFMIGNTDWSFVRLHNILPIRDLAATGNSGVTAVPFDFDFSGLVYAKYAGPPPHLPITSTRQRLYRGFCNTAIDWDAVFAQFQAIRPQVFERLENLPELSASGLRGSRKFLKGFYQVIDDPERRQKTIIDNCRPPPVAARK